MTETCRHPRRKHTVWYYVEDGGPPVPCSITFDNRKDAVKWAEEGTAVAGPYLRWVKIFRSDNEAYTCWRWESPDPIPEPEPTPPLAVEQRHPSRLRRLFARPVR